MNDNHAIISKQRIRKIVSLAVLGIALGLAANQVLVSLKHEVTVDINLSGDLVRDLKQLELRVSEAGTDSEAASLTRFFFDDSHRPSSQLTHTLNITNGRYELCFTMYQSDDRKIIVLRPLDVSGAMQVSYHLP
jgi:hypothetical protein